MSPHFFNSQDDLTIHKLHSEYYIVVCKKSLFMQELAEATMVRLVELLDAVLL